MDVSPARKRPGAVAAMAGVRDLAIFLTVLFIHLPLSILSVLARRLCYPAQMEPMEDLRRGTIRCLSLIPIRLLRLFLGSPATQTALMSKRLSTYRDQLCVEVSMANFTGYWVCKGPPGEPRPARECDLVILWCHGGGYCLGHVLGSLVTLWRASEILAATGKSVGILSVKYTLAPRSVFPTQQKETVAAFRHLLDAESIDAEKIIVAGESAGGHLALASLIGIAEEGLPKPGSALLMSPWIDLRNSGRSFETNKHKDVLAKGFVDRCASLAVGSAADGTRAHSSLTSMISSGPSRSWKTILPQRTWVNVGSHETFIDDIECFVQQAKADGASVELDTTEGMPHGWTIHEDRKWESYYLNLEHGEAVLEEALPGSKVMATGLSFLLS